MKHRATLLALAVSAAALAGAPAAAAQDPGVPQAQRRPEGAYAHLFTFEFLPGKTDEGLTILRDHLLPAWRAAGVEPILIESLIGTKDLMLIVPLAEGPRYFEWTVPAQDARAWSALVRAAGPERAEQIVDRFVGLLARQSQDFVFLPARRGPE